MKRDMDLIREILLQIETFEDDDTISGMQIEGYSHEEITYHVLLLNEAGLIQAKILYGMDSVMPENYEIFRMTWEGYDFLEACRDETRWNQAKGVIGDIRGASFEVIKMILIELMKTQAVQFIS